jgi:NAD(P)-dependent dehydrogenase (short-subunit alcohol dehydrogenase family)
MSDRDLTGTTALVTGASRGFGRGIATALSRAGAQVVGVARDRGALEDLGAELGGSFTAVAADAADPVVAGQLIDTYRPATLVLNAGATPLPRPIHHQTWQTFSRNWEVDVQHVFNFTREALLAPLAPGSTVITLSSGAALRGSPLSGGYAGAKALLPQLTPATDLGARYTAAYAARGGVTTPGGPPLTPERAGQAVADLAADPGSHDSAYLLTAEGLRPLPPGGPL